MSDPQTACLTALCRALATASCAPLARAPFLVANRRSCWAVLWTRQVGSWSMAISWISRCGRGGPDPKPLRQRSGSPPPLAACQARQRHIGAPPGGAAAGGCRTAGGGTPHQSCPPWPACCLGPTDGGGSGGGFEATETETAGGDMGATFECPFLRGACSSSRVGTLWKRRRGTKNNWGGICAKQHTKYVLEYECEACDIVESGPSLIMFRTRLASLFRPFWAIWRPFQPMICHNPQFSAHFHSLRASLDHFEPVLAIHLSIIGNFKQLG